MLIYSFNLWYSVYRMTTKLTVTKRDNKKITAEELPAVVYGPKQETISIAIDAKEFGVLLKKAGESTIVTLEGLDEPIEVLIKQVDFDPIKHIHRHVDFYAIERGKDMTTNVPVVFVGEPPVEKSGLGFVTKVHNEISVTCRPSDLPSEIEVDISGLVEIHDRVLLSDLKLPKGIVINLEEGEVIASVTENRKTVEPETTEVEEEMDAADVPVAGAEEEEDKESTTTEG